MNRIPAEVIRAEGTHVEEPLDLELGNLHEQAEIGDARHDGIEGLAELVLHELALEPVQRVPGRLVRAAFHGGTQLAELLHLGAIVDKRTGRSAAQQMPDTPVHQQVRVAPDRRGEMGILLQREAEVADVLRLIHGLLQRAQHHGFDQGLVRPAADLHDDVVVVGGRDPIATAEFDAVRLEEQRQLLHALLRRPGVDPIQRRQSMSFQELRRFDIGGDHAFLDDPVSIVTAARYDPGDAPVAAERKTDFGDIEFDRPASAAGLEQSPKYGVEMFEMR